MSTVNIQDYIREQPDVMRRVLDEIPRAIRKFPDFLDAEAVYMIGSGTSRNALLAVEPFFSKCASSAVQIKGPLSFLNTAEGKKGGSSVAIILSQTGTSTTTIQAVNHARGLGMRTITLTAEEKSPIVSASSEVLIIPAGPEPVGPKTKGYSASVLSLLLLALRPQNKNLQVSSFLDAYASLIEQSQDIIRAVAEDSRKADYFLVMGQDRHYATALEGSLKITEMSGIPSGAFETEEAFHGRFHGLNSKSRAIFISASPAQQEMAARGAAVLAELGVGVGILNLSGGLASPFDLRLPWPPTTSFLGLDLLSAIIPFQYLGWHLARGKGMVPEKMRYPNLSQKLGIKTQVQA